MQTFMNLLQWPHLAIFASYCLVGIALFKFALYAHTRYLHKKLVVLMIEKAVKNQLRFTVDDIIKRRTKAAEADLDSTAKQPAEEMRLDEAWRKITVHVLSNVKSSLETNDRNPSVKQWAEYQQQAINKMLVNYTGDAITLARPQEKSYVSPVIAAALMHSFLASPVVEHEIKFYKP